ncbi:hypothetical protein [Treponema brennaborense]|nr:hypothetical protein [Treponema brennaborense]
MNEMSAGAAEINTSAQTVSEMAVQTHENIQTVKRLVYKFKLRER